MDREGQGAIEYLLIIGAAILVVAVVVIALVTVTQAGTDSIGAENITGTYDELKCLDGCNAVGGTYAAGDCTGRTDIEFCLSYAR